MHFIHSYVCRVNHFLLQSSTNTEHLCQKLEEFIYYECRLVSDPAVLWNAHKSYIRGFFIQLSSKLKKRRTQNLEELAAAIATADFQNKSHPSPSLQTQIFKLRHELCSLLLESFEITQCKLKAKSYAKNRNKAGKPMALRIKEHRLKSKIAYLYHLTTCDKLLNPQSIADAFSCYYSNLYNINAGENTYQPSQEEIQPFLNHINLLSLSSVQICVLKTPFSTDEIKKVIEKLPNSKSPGPDGFTGEYFKTFQSILTPHLCDLYNHVASSSSFPNEILSALVITLPKTRKGAHIPPKFSPHIPIEP